MAVNVPIISEWRDKGLKTASRDIDGFSKKAKRQFDGLAAAGRKIALGFAAGTAATAAFAKSAVNAASDFDESASKLGVIIGDASDAVIDFAKNASAIGISANEAAEAAGKFAIFGKAAGLAGDDLATFSTDFVKLSADMASFNNASPEDVMEAIGAALRGQALPLQRYGVLLNDATMRQAALELGIYSGNGALTAQQKILAAQKVIYAQTGDAQGDFERTSQGLANQQRILAARLSNLRIEIGMKLLPIFTKFAGFLVNRLYPAVERFTRFAWRRLTDAFQTARPFLERIVSLFNDQIRPAIERLVKFMEDNENVVKAFLAVLAGAAVIAGLAALAKTLGLLLNPIGLIVVAIAGLVAGFVYLYENSERFRNFMDGIGRWFRDEFPIYFRKAVDIITPIWERFLNGLMFMVDSLILNLGRIFSGMWKLLQGIFNVGAGVLQGDWSRVWKGLGQIFEGSWKIILGLIGLAFIPFLVAWAVFGDDIKRIWNAVWQEVTGNLAKYAIQIIFIVPRLLTLPFVMLWRLFGDEIKEVWNRLWEMGVIPTLLKWAANIIFLVPRILTAPFLILWNLFGDDIKRIWGTIWNGVMIIFDNTAGRIIGVVTGIIDAVTRAIAAIKSLGDVPIPNPVSAIGGVVSGVAGAIGGAARRIGGILPFADGGLVMNPVVGLVGEAGPELVIPLDKLGQMGGGDTINVYVQGSVVSERDLIEQIRVGLIRSQRSGRPLVA
jgi:phage-related protein